MGRQTVEADSKTVAINSKATVEAYKFAKALYHDAMDTDMLAWDDRNNNVCLTSGKCSMILNPISAYNSARVDHALLPGTQRPIHQVINHIMPHFFDHWLLNTTIVTVLATAISVVIGVLAAYALARLRFRGVEWGGVQNWCGGISTPGGR